MTTIAELPAVIRDYLAAPRAEATLRVYAPGAVVTDEGATYRGADEIGAWMRRTSGEYSYTATPTAISHDGDGRWTVTQHLSGDFPGGEVDLRYRFHLSGDRIAELDIAP